MEYTSKELAEYLMPNGSTEQKEWVSNLHEGFVRSSVFTLLLEQDSKKNAQ